MGHSESRQPAEVTIRDVAAAAGVSIGTASRVLNNHPSVRASLRDSVLRAAKELEYAPNEMARLLRSSRTHAIAILVDDVVHSMNGMAAHGAEDAAEARGYSVIVGESRGEAAAELALVHSMLARRVEGLLSMPIQSRATLLQAAHASRTPIVFFGQVTLREGTISAVVDEEEATASAVRELLRQGHRRFGLIGDGHPGMERRMRRIEQYVRDGCGEKTSVTRTVAAIAEMDEAAAWLLSGDDRPTAVMVLLHQCLPAVLLGVRMAGLSVPADISVITYGDSEWARAYRPSISVIQTDYELHVRQATDRLIDLIEGRRQELTDLVHRSDFVLRESVGPLPDPHHDQ